MKTEDSRACGGMGLYVHVPFCLSRCPYCDFVSTAGLSRSWQERYRYALLKEWAIYEEEYAATEWETLYFGGGTPTYLDEDILERLIDGLLSTSPLEFTVEANPGTLHAGKLAMLHRAGCDRLSVGAQSFDNDRLAWLGRSHNADGFRRAWGMAREAGFTNMNMDLMYGLPDQSPGQWGETLGQALAHQPEHISLYQLHIEEGTPLARRADAGEVCAADEEIGRQQYLLAHRTLTDAGYRHYEISNYAKPGYESRHNQLYWRNGYYLGLGAGAAGHRPGSPPVRYTNQSDLEGYLADLKQGRLPVAEREEIGAELAMAEECMLAFRLREGVAKEPFRERWGFSLRDKYSQALERRLAEGLLEEDEEAVRPTLEGWLQYNNWITDFM